MTQVRGLRAAVDAMHDHIWDDERGMVQLYGLHLVRETALGAFADLERGNVERAQRGLREVLLHQYAPGSDPRWAGTFKTHAAQPDAGSIDADGRVRDREWHDYDPNWRQFLGVILWVTERLYGHVLEDDLRQRMMQAVHIAARSEPVGRIAASYSNIALMHAWLCDVTATPTSLTADIAAQVTHDGDIAEYNSPTYDAIALLAGCLLTQFSQTEPSRQLGALVIDRIASRLNALWHLQLGLQAGPHIRAYGLEPRSYVSLMSVMMAAIDVRAAGPTTLDNTTTHVHDLYFLPLFARLCGALRGRVQPEPITATHRYEQRFGDIIATSIMEPDMVVGWEHGRRTRFALDQYAPFTMYAADGFIGVRTRVDTDWVDVQEVAPHVYELRMARRTDTPTPHDSVALTIVASRPPITHGNEMLFGRVTLQYPGLTVEVRLPRASE